LLPPWDRVRSQDRWGPQNPQSAVISFFAGLSTVSEVSTYAFVSQASDPRHSSARWSACIQACSPEIVLASDQADQQCAMSQRLNALVRADYDRWIKTIKYACIRVE
jgi:hypothetical protein